jgi:L-ascorbate metabolism protein UlaG (beta-lactamase superfamily)
VTAPVGVRYVGGPTAVVELAGARLLLDPTFDPPGDYPIGERTLTKTAPPALTPAEVGRIDAVLLSHDQHPDNLDRLGREYLAGVPRVFSTASAAARLPIAITALANWESAELVGPGGPGGSGGPAPVRVTGVPAQHGPDGSEALVGEVTGFVVSGGGRTVYISGDNASLAVVRTIGDRLGPFDAVVLFAGAARTALAGGAPLTLTSELAADAVDLLGRPPTVLVHFEGWGHFSEGADPLQEAFVRRGTSSYVHIPMPGERIEL